MKQLLMVCCAAVFSTAVAKTYYVNPVAGEGNDDWDGEAEVWEGGESQHGPKRTLVGVTAVAKTSGDVIIALPGTYDQELVAVAIAQCKDDANAEQYARVVIPAGVTLKSRDGAEKTIIMGKAADKGVKSCYNCGSGTPARCVNMGANSRLEGFTLTGGHTYATGTKVGEYWGAISDVSTSLIVDCIISNNVAVRCGAMNCGLYFGCRFTHNRGIELANTGASPGLYNCFVDYGLNTGSYEFYTGGTAKLVNSTLGSNVNQAFRGNGGKSGSITFYNCIDLSVLGAQFGKYYNSALRTLYASATMDGTSFMTTADAMALNDDGSLSEGSEARDKGDSALYDKNLNKSFAALSGRDLFAGQRVMNGQIDLGCAEFDVRPILSTELNNGESALCAVVTNVTPLVEAGEKYVVLPMGEEMDVSLQLSEGRETDDFQFKASVTGSGTLSVYRTDEPAPLAVVTAADGEKSVDFSAGAGEGLRFVTTGTDGTATVRAFAYRRAYVNLDIGDTGIEITGAKIEKGFNDVSAGEVTFTIRRKDDGSVCCAGITVNGTYYDFYDYPDGLTYTVRASDWTTSVDIIAVYKEGLQDWYVDGVNGDDTYSGLYTNRAFKTITAAMRNAALQSGETVHVYPGVYDDGLFDEDQPLRSRVHVPAGVTLASVDGAAATVIKGAKSTHACKTSYGNGTNAVRCVYLENNANLIGFTLADGRSSNSFLTDGDRRNESAGGVFAANNSLVVDCIFTNCMSAYRGGALHSAVGRIQCVRCLFVDNYSEDRNGTVDYGAPSFYNCLFKDNSNGKNAGHAVYNSGSASGGPQLYNCTFLQGNQQYGVRGGTRCYNCVFVCTLDGGANNKNSEFYSCQFATRPVNISQSVLDVNCVTNCGAALALDATGRLGTGSVCIDAGSNQLYTANFPASRQPNLDFYGSSRYYNKRIDVGCCEYDWRGDFAKDLTERPRHLAVTEASANVTETDEKKVSLVDGTTLTAVFSTKLAGEQNYSLKAEVTGAGTLTVTLPDGTEVTVTAADGDKTIAFTNAAAENEVSFAYKGAGNALLHDFVPPIGGSLLMVR